MFAGAEEQNEEIKRLKRENERTWAEWCKQKVNKLALFEK